MRALISELEASTKTSCTWRFNPIQNLIGVMLALTYLINKLNNETWPQPQQVVAQ